MAPQTQQIFQKKIATLFKLDEKRCNLLDVKSKSKDIDEVFDSCNETSMAFKLSFRKLLKSPPWRFKVYSWSLNLIEIKLLD